MSIYAWPRVGLGSDQKRILIRMAARFAGPGEAWNATARSQPPGGEKAGKGGVSSSDTYVTCTAHVRTSGEKNLEFGICILFTRPFLQYCDLFDASKSKISTQLQVPDNMLGSPNCVLAEIFVCSKAYMFYSLKELPNEK